MKRAYRVHDYNNDYEAYFFSKNEALACAINRCTMLEYYVTSIETENDDIIIGYDNMECDDIMTIRAIDIM